MNETSGSVGGVAAWAPSHLPPRGVDLTPAQELACAVRHLDIAGFSENMTGHVSWQQPGSDTLLVNPWGYWWREVKGSDVLEVGLDATVVSGEWDVTPAIHIHTELHRRRPDARVVVHSHPMFASVLAAVPELPELVHQNSSILAGQMVLVHARCTGGSAPSAQPPPHPSRRSTSDSCRHRWWSGPPTSTGTAPSANSWRPSPGSWTESIRVTPLAPTTAGVLSGIDTEHGVAFRGVRYAAATRFGAPRPVDPWDGVVAADTIGVAAPQPITSDPAIPDMAVGAIGEDCLRAEVWTPSPKGRRPVLVWIPGGRYQIGGAGLATYDGARLAAEGDLVVIGVNYRLGALGFLAADGVPSNLGLRDLIAALRWVRAEAAAFGGDPDDITIMGESAGAGAITHLLASPSAHGLFDRAIVASAAPGATLDRVEATTVAETFLATAGVARVDELAVVGLEELLGAQAEADTALLASVGMMPFHPWVDDDLLPAAPLDADLAPVPLVIGTTRDEMALFRDRIPTLPHDIAISWLASKCSTFAADPLGAARAGLAACDGDLADAVADTDLHVPAQLLADRHARRGLAVWRYRFDWDAPGLGAAHATDLPFHFGTLDVADWRATLGATGGRATDADRLSGAMRAAWASFCHTGTPACEPVGRWPPHDPTHRRATLLGAPVAVADDVGGAHLRAWTETNGAPT